MYTNELIKAYFTHDPAYPDNKDLAKRTISDNNLIDKAYEIALNRKYDGYQGGLLSIAYKLFFDKETGSRARTTESRITQSSD